MGLVRREIGGIADSFPIERLVTVEMSALRRADIQFFNPSKSMKRIQTITSIALLACLFSQKINAEDGLGLLSDDKLLADLQGVNWGNDWTSSVGGSLRYRYLNERNRLRPPLVAGQSDYQQWRFTPYLELKYRQDVTFFAEAIDASTFGEDLPEVAIDTNRLDLLRYFADINLYDFDDQSSVHFKVGRQFLKYGSQHLISPLGWANTFRNFEGGKLYYTSPDWDIDAFLVRPVHEPTAAVQPKSVDSPDQSRMFTGIYSTYKGFSDSTLDIYWLWLREQDDRLDRQDGNRHTIGARYAGKKPLTFVDSTFNWDVEGAYQFGKDDFGSTMDEDVNAGFVSANGGLAFNNIAWKPAINGIFWWGSGDDDPGDGTNNTVSTLPTWTCLLGANR